MTTEATDEHINNTAPVCRICLQTSHESQELLPLFEKDPNSSNVFVYEKIEECAGIKIMKKPELPSSICKKCNAFLTIAYKFRIMCKNSDNYLREFVCKDVSKEDSSENEQYLLECNDSVTGQTEKNDTQFQNEDSQDSMNTEDFANEEYSEFWLKSTENDDMFENLQDIGEHSDNDDDGGGAGIEITADDLENSQDSSISHANENNHAKEPQKYICDMCGNSYARKYVLEAHMRRHRHDKTFECDICGQAFLLNFELKRHLRKHTSARPFGCQYCQRTFSDRSSMKKHERIHRNERPFKCEICGKSFTYSSVLKAHQLTHTGEKPFK
uniref:C2H2-type Zn-finger protein n=1 Tax=Glossina morsitans morsitans TaxID=37546 RepID=D3TS48_GLOMM